MNWTLLLPLEPVDDARLVEFAKTFQARQFHPNLVVLHANGTLLRSTIFPNTVFLSRLEMKHSDR